MYTVCLYYVYMYVHAVYIQENSKKVAKNHDEKEKRKIKWKTF